MNDRRNEIERPGYPGIEECHLLTNNSLQIKERIARGVGWGAKEERAWSSLDQELGLLHSPRYMQHHYSTVFSTMNSLRAATEFYSTVYMQYLALVLGPSKDSVHIC